MVIRSAVLATVMCSFATVRARAEDLVTDDVYASAESAGVDAVELQGAVNTTGYGADEYLCLVGEGACPTPAQVPAWTVWDRLAQCESGGNWHVDAYHDGGLQFLPSTWTAYKPAGYPAYAWQASREQQIVVAERVLAAAGWSQWPVCSRRIGVR